MGIHYDRPMSLVYFNIIIFYLLILVFIIHEEKGSEKWKMEKEEEKIKFKKFPRRDFLCFCFNGL